MTREIIGSAARNESSMSRSGSFLCLVEMCSIKNAV